MERWEPLPRDDEREEDVLSVLLQIHLSGKVHLTEKTHTHTHTSQVSNVPHKTHQAHKHKAHRGTLSRAMHGSSACIHIKSHRNTCLRYMYPCIVLEKK